MKARSASLRPNGIEIPGFLARQTGLGGPQPDITAERIIFWTIALVPLWWILGLQVAVYPLVGWYLFYRSFRRPVQISFPFGWNMWCLYIGIWLLSLVVNLALGTAEIGRSITALGSISGVWALMVIVWYAMRRLGIRYPTIVRAICIVGLCQLIAVVMGQTYLQVTGSPLQTQSLITTLVPSIPAGVFFDASLYGYDSLGWDVDLLPRLKSFYYWSPLAGTMSIFICMAALTERNRFWQVTGFIGGLATIWFAGARSAQVGVVAAVLVAAWFGGRLGRRAILGCLIPIAIFSPVIVTELYKYFFEYRQGSAAGRFALYDETLKAFLNSPFIGYGAQGRSDALNDIPLGSHSQLYSTLYQTGVFGAGILAAAWIGIAIALMQLILKQPKLSPVLGAWVGLTLVMPSGELAAASVTVFTLAAWMGVSWNWEEQMSLKARLPWLSVGRISDPPAPWQSQQHRWSGSTSTRV
jgi:hypothetical protein